MKSMKAGLFLTLLFCVLGSSYAYSVECYDGCYLAIDVETDSEEYTESTDFSNCNSTVLTTCASDEVCQIGTVTVAGTSSDSTVYSVEFMVSVCAATSTSISTSTCDALAEDVTGSESWTDLDIGYAESYTSSCTLIEDCTEDCSLITSASLSYHPGSLLILMAFLALLA